MGKSPAIPAAVVRRLSLYLRHLEAVNRENCSTVSSRQLGASVNTSDAQVRKDLAYFGQFGQAGVGYGVDDLIQSIRQILGTDRTWNVALIGAGNLGQALISYRGFDRKGFCLVAVFDADLEKVGKLADGERRIRVEPMSALAKTVRQKKIDLAILAVPAEVAQAVADQAVEAGVKGLLNFAPASLRLPEDVVLRAVDLSVALEELSFRLSGSS
ncbi:MAG: redox-sensing transcriptional repressor Rex [Phycisphaerae bacterium]